MADSSLVGYIGDPDFHDGSVLAVEQQDSSVRVRVRGASGRIFVVAFGEVQAVRAKRPEGMLLHALSEMSGELPLRRFVFANWDEESEAFLEVDAETIAVEEE